VLILDRRSARGLFTTTIAPVAATRPRRFAVALALAAACVSASTFAAEHAAAQTTPASSGAPIPEPSAGSPGEPTSRPATEPPATPPAGDPPASPPGSAAPAASAAPSAAPSTPSTVASGRLWNPAWTRFQPTEYVTTAIAGGVTMLLFTAGQPATRAKWEGGILFDDAARDALRVRSVNALSNARLAGDIATLAPVAYVLAASAFIPAFRHDLDTAWQLTMMNAQAFIFSGLVTWTMFEVVGRARPSQAECAAGRSQDPLCGAGSFSSFPSGHTASAFTAAGLTCAHHGKVALYGNAGDTAACISTLAIATTAGVLRLVGDRHYVSDVVVGGTLGFLIGYGMPMLLHYRERPLGEIHRSATSRIGLTLGSPSSPLGAAAYGIF